MDQATRHIRIPTQLTVVATLAQLLERMGSQIHAIGAAQYQSIVRHLSDELAKVETDDALDAVLRTFPAAAEVYENLNYEHAGLCRSPLDLSLNTELQARAAIEHAARRPVA